MREHESNLLRTELSSVIKYAKAENLIKLRRIYFRIFYVPLPLALTRF